MSKRNIITNCCKSFLFLSFLLVQNTNAQDLQWTKESQKRVNWYDAKKYCKNLESRLPTYNEIESVWLSHNKSSEIDGFDLSVSYWTSKVEKTDFTGAYPFYFGEGKKGWYYKADHYGVRCIKK